MTVSVLSMSPWCIRPFRPSPISPGGAILTLKPLARLLLALVFILAGVNHFRQPGLYRAIMPPSLPQPEFLVALSGWAEIGLGALVLVPRAQRLAGYGLVVLLLAVFPANLHMAANADHFPQIPTWLLWARLPFQPLFIAWTLWATAPEE